MTGVNWALGVMPDIGGNAMAAFERGRQQREQQDARKALTAYAVNQTPESLNALAPYNPEFVIKERDRLAASQRERQEQRRADLPLIGRLLDNATDDASWQQSLNIAREYGIDTSELPATYDPTVIAQYKQTLQLLQDPKAQEALSTAGKLAVDRGYKPGTPEFNKVVTEIWMAEQNKTIPYTQGGGVAGYNSATGQTFTIIQPNPGGYETGAPVGSRGTPDLPPGFQLDGGPTPPASGNFRP